MLLTTCYAEHFKLFIDKSLYLKATTYIFIIFLYFFIFNILVYRNMALQRVENTVIYFSFNFISAILRHYQILPKKAIKLFCLRITQNT